MTPEERWIKIENAFQALQAQHEADITESRGQIAENRTLIAENAKQIARMGEQWERRASQIDAQIEKNTAAIKDLIPVSRTVLDAQQRTDERMARLHSEINAKLEQLLKTVDAFFRRFQKPNGSQ